MKKGVAEILKEASEKQSRKEKIEHLQRNQSVPLMMVLQYALDPNIQWILPEGAPPYKPNDLVDQESIFYAEARRLKNWIKGVNPGFEKQTLKHEAQFIQLLEMVDKEDAKLLVAVKDKKIPYPGITYKLVKEAFPNILP
jgi:hypothetical protein